jgi:hypothetical protein
MLLQYLVNTYVQKYWVGGKPPGLKPNLNLVAATTDQPAPACDVPMSYHATFTVLIGGDRSLARSLVLDEKILASQVPRHCRLAGGLLFMIA